MINKLFDRYQPNHPGCQVAISRNGEIIFSKAWGLANLDNNVPYTIETVTEAGSISKQFTAAAILILAQQGKLSLDDDLRKYLPEFPDYGHTIRLKNLLHHTSGIREWSNLEAITGWPRTTKAYTNAEVFATLCRQQKLNNVPGAEFIYSNSNYILLALIVEKVSGMSLPDFTQKYIFTPAGMTHTSWRDNYRKIVPNRGIAYSLKDGHYQINMPNESVYGPGGLLTTAEDLLKWAAFYLNNKLGNPGLLNQQLATEKLADGTDNDYAAGLVIDQQKGLVSHNGQTAGYVGIVENFKKQNISIAYLSNSTEFKDDLFGGVNGIEKLFIKPAAAETTPANKAQTAVTLSPEKLKKYVGWYSIDKVNEGVEIALRHDTLLFRGNPMVPVSEHDFTFNGNTVTFGNEGQMLVTRADKRKIQLKKEITAKVTPAYLKTFAGTYYSKETESNFTLLIKDGKLMLEKDNIKDAALIPTYRQAFNVLLNLDGEIYPVGANLLFETNNKKAITQCKVSMGNARGMSFIRIK
ncbi:serine hydrolase domain-containing protein [Mucilaginibacter sp. X4EP1]|uniref:serine hydrolase domain-containing protein n=1 Tax=Mucilaginibacter sp. X4EP1 TaxID=2723092 RepID=UPI002167C526|nr:serine hydrolase domain-containing protein [Mucilaginibacter sp. X4EP1]MCS3811606.1 CubicO group peptidase (beta-lactamase class C family) [Mucilaginibacter sp. X4EP1]